MIQAMTLRLLIVDGYRMFAEALAANLASADGITVVGTATEAARTFELARTFRPDVVTLDADLGDADGIEVARELQMMAAPPKIVMVTCVADIDRILHAIWAGALGWVPKEIGTETLLDVIRGAAHGDAWFPPPLLGTVLHTIVSSSDGEPPDRTPMAALTPRERQVLRCMLAGLDRGATARLLGLSLNTVRTHAQSVLAKLHVHSALEAVAVALSAGMRPETAPAPLRRLGVVQTTRAPQAVLRTTTLHLDDSSRTAAQSTPAPIGVGMLVRWPDPKHRAGT